MNLFVYKSVINRRCRNIGKYKQIDDCFQLIGTIKCLMKVIVHINIFKSGELNGKHMFHLGTYGISATGVLKSSNERQKIPTITTTAHEARWTFRSGPEAETRTKRGST